MFRFRVFLVTAFCFSFLFCCLSDADAGSRRKRWPRKIAQFALGKDKMPAILKDHPRLMLRREKWDYGVSVGELKAHLAGGPWASRFKKPPKDNLSAALYYLVTGDESVVPRVVKDVIKSRWTGGRKEAGPALRLALQYDWIASSKKISDADRKAMQENLARHCRSAMGKQEYHGDFWHHRGAGRQVLSMLAPALAMAGDCEEGDKLAAQALGYLHATYLPGFAHTGGLWQGGGRSYYELGAVNVPTIMYIYASARQDDLFKLIREKYDNWFEGMMEYFMYQAFPDRSTTALSGFHNNTNIHYPWWRQWLIFSRATGRAEPYAFPPWVTKMDYHFKSSYMTRDVLNALLYDPQLAKKAPKSFANAPAAGARLWGRKGRGYVQFRSKGWKPDSTVVEFCCGDVFWSHTFHANQNSFYIFHKGRLAIHAGWYQGGPGGYYGSFMRHYYCRTVASNSMLVVDPKEFSWGPSKSIHRVDGKGCYPEYGGQRLCRGSCNVMSMKEYLARKDGDPSGWKGQATQHWECGNIIAFDHAKDYSWSYVCGDATGAYNNPKRVYRTKSRKNVPKIDLFTRSMVFLEGKYLVVFDRVNSLEKTFRKAWLINSVAKPEVSGKPLKAEVAGHIEDFDGDTFRIDYRGSLKPPKPTDPGRLLGRCLLPEKRVIRRIGGKGYENWVLGVNHLGKRGRYWRKDPGDWRLEVSPAEAANFDNFLFLLMPCDARTDKLPPAATLRAEGEKAVGISVGSWAVLFCRRTSEIAGELAYKAPAGARRHLVCDLARSTKYRLSGAGGASREVTSSAEGALEFQAPGAATIKLTPVK